MPSSSMRRLSRLVAGWATALLCPSTGLLCTSQPGATRRPDQPAALVDELDIVLVLGPVISDEQHAPSRMQVRR